MPCDPNTLLEQARCLTCIPQGMMQAVNAALLCQIMNGGGGGGGGTDFPQTGLIHYWRMEESGVRSDSVGSADMTDTSVTAVGAGKQNNAAQFDWNGVNYGALSSSPITIPSAFSIVVWFKFSAVDLNQTISVNGATDPDGFPIGFVASCDAVAVDTLQFSFSEEGAMTVPGIAFDTGWHLVCLTAVGTTASIYYDGVEVASDPAATIDFSDWSSFTCAAGNSGTSAGTAGSIDEVSVFNTAIDAATVAQIWNAGAGNFLP